ncbi:hypothetical protein [Salinilacihabitans rarus]|uniref:hypothetical protein n=1 Tax=Salinilacihabitans rarus TaxID=2961596 RepID=UPI0020C91826|nr:hypothetical protein [Salinilacihabitans rarus]
MSLRRHLLCVFVPRALATVAALAGLALPWTRVNPEAEVVPDVYLAGMGAGVETVGAFALPVLLVLLLAPALVAVVGRAAPHVLAAVTALCGLLLALVAASHGLALSTRWGSTFVPAVGAYLTAGVGLAVCAWAAVEWRYLDDAAAIRRRLAGSDGEE